MPAKRCARPSGFEDKYLLSRFVGIAGVLTIIGIAVLASRDRRRIPWRMVFWAIILQLIFGVFVLKTRLGQDVLGGTAGAVTALIGYADYGGQFVFDFLARDPTPYIFAFRVLPIVIFISCFFTCLYHLGIMQLIVLGMARIMKRFLGVSGAESLAAAANVFMGQTEAPLVIAPYIPGMTYSELMALMTGGMATVSGAILGAYIGYGINAEYLITGSLMAAPAALMMAKIMVPETGEPLTAGEVRLKIERTDVNLIEAAARGAAQGLKLALNIAAMLIAFIAMTYLLNAVLSWCGRGVGLERILGAPVTLQLLLGYLLAPLAFVMGVPLAEATSVGRLLGLKIVLNEVIAYADLAEIKETLSPRSELIATFALCGFANFASLGIQLGGIGPLAPDRRKDLATVGPRALLAGALATCLTATLAGLIS